MTANARRTIRAYYQNSAEREATRLDSSYRRIELRVWTQILKSLPIVRGPRRILDLGCGPSPVSLRLGLGSENLILVDFAASLFDLLPPSAPPCVCADAVNLPFPRDYFDLVLASGPFYHLPNSGERAGASLELLRVLRPGGVAVVTGLNPTGVAAAKLGEVNLDAATIVRSIALQKKLGGLLPAGALGDFPDAFVTHPKRLASELASAGFIVRSIVGLQGGMGLLRRPLARIALMCPRCYELWSTFAVRYCRSFASILLSEHFSVVVEKPLDTTTTDVRHC